MPTIFERFFQMSIGLLATADTGGYFRDLNPAWTETLGFSLEELRAKPFIDFVHPDDREATVHAAAQLRVGVSAINFENRYQCKDGSYKWLSWVARFSPEDGVIFATARDITANKRLLAEKEVAQAARDRFRALADNTSDFVGMTDAAGRVTYLNPAGHRMVGRTEVEIAQSVIADFHPPEHTELVVREGLAHAQSIGPWIHDGSLRTKAGQLLPISQVIVALRDTDGQLVGFGTIIRDLSVITHFKSLEQELRNQQTSLREILHAMSTPIIPITEQIVVMPLIGSMDSQRAEQFLNDALEGAAARRAQVFIIDITGLRHIDTSVAAALIKTASALRLLGAQVVLTGISAELARTLVSLGVDLRSMNTQSNLQSGIQYALTVSAELSPRPQAAAGRPHAGGAQRGAPQTGPK